MCYAVEINLVVMHYVSLFYMSLKTNFKINSLQKTLIINFYLIATIKQSLKVYDNTLMIFLIIKLKD